MRWIAGLLTCWFAMAQVATEREPGRRQFPVQLPLQRVSAATPFSSTCSTAALSGTVYLNAAVEPWLAVNPSNRRNLIGVWQQDRWSSGGANGLLTAVSLDAGLSWTIITVPFSQCSGGKYERATDPWVSFAPDGSVYQISYSFNQSNAGQAMLVSRSGDQGFSWSQPVTLLADTAAGIEDDKESITADPTDAHYAYAVWDRLTGLGSANSANFRGPVWFARTSDGGASWEPARIIYDPGSNAQTIANQIVVLPDGTLVDGFELIRNAGAPLLRDNLIYPAVIRSTDHGATWSDAILIAQARPVGVSDVKTSVGVRTAAVLPSLAVDAKRGTLYAVWEDAQFSNLAREGIAFASSVDGGLTWSAPVQVNQAPNVQAFNPAIAVRGDGTIAITYFDFRTDSTDPATLLTSFWRITSQDQGNTWNEAGLFPAFNLLTAPLAQGQGYFIGDYTGLAASGEVFYAFFAATNSGNTANPTDVFITSEPAAGTDTRGNGHVEVNRLRIRRREDSTPHPDRKRRR
ncbi:MAG TPA: sialidase family protein [Bryobacteraceae bacterium]|nr:sialidase family protein [Bryobacteraceae bacterium]